MGARVKKLKPLTEEQTTQFREDLLGASEEDVTTFEEDDDPLSLAGDFVEEDEEGEGKA